MDAFDVDGSVAPVTVLRLKTADVGDIEKQLRVAMKRTAPYSPVIVDVAALDEASAMELPLHDLAERQRACKLVPVGAANLPASAVWNAAAAGMAIVELAAPPPPPPPTTTTPTTPTTTTPTTPTTTTPATPTASTTPSAPPLTSQPATAISTLTVRQPVRSGQVIYAQHADLIVLGPVNSGAQVVADGHIHIYGALRGRALAGAKGMTDACVFVQSLEAELVAIAGHYLPSDKFPVEYRGARVQLSLESGRFRIQPL
jgi:septum site-determining protein MinC